MIKWALIFAVIAIVAGLLSFTGIAAGSAAIAKVLFFIAIAMLVILLVVGAFVGKKLSR